MHGAADYVHVLQQRKTKQNYVADNALQRCMLMKMYAAFEMKKKNEMRPSAFENVNRNITNVSMFFITPPPQKRF